MSIEVAVENIKLLTNRLSLLETKINNITVDRTEAQAQPSGENENPPVQEDLLGATAEEEIQRQGSTIVHKVSSQEIDRIKESLSKVSLPQELKLKDS